MDKIVSVDQIDSLIEEINLTKSPIILAGGCFDVLHPGHISFLSEAKKIGGTLIVQLESDEKIKKLKGTHRPIYSQQDRAYILSHLDMVDYVLPLPYFGSDEEYKKLIFKIHPHYFAITKNDPVMVHIQPQAKELNAKIYEVIERIDRYASSNAIKELNI